MKSSFFSRRARLPATLLSLLVAFLVVGCSDDGTGPSIEGREVGVVLASTDLALTIFDVDDPSARTTVGLGADGSPVSMAIRGKVGVVPMGIVPAVAVVDVREGVVLRTIPLPAGSGATGVDFLNDSVALVANPDLGTVSPVNVLAGTTGAEIEVGRYPQSVAVAGGRAYVLNAELEDFVPAGPSTITVLDAATLGVLDTIELSGENATDAALGPDGRLYVLHAGSWGAGNGALSVVNLATREEVAYQEGFGDFPGSLAVGEDGRVYVAGWGIGILVWDSGSQTFVRDLDDPVAPLGMASTSGIGLDGEGRLYALAPDCQNPSEAHRLSATYVSEVAVPVGICPIAITFAEVEGGS